MSDHESQPLVVHLEPDERYKCTATVEIAAAGFDISPPDTTRKIDLDPSRPVESLTWLVAAKSTGDYLIVVRAGRDNHTVGIVVTDVLGFRAATAKVLEAVLWVVGPALTVPWWIDTLKAWRLRRP